MGDISIINLSDDCSEYEVKIFLEEAESEDIKLIKAGQDVRIDWLEVNDYIVIKIKPVNFE